MKHTTASTYIDPIFMKRDYALLKVRGTDARLASSDIRVDPEHKKVTVYASSTWFDTIDAGQAHDLIASHVADYYPKYKVAKRSAR